MDKKSFCITRIFQNPFKQSRSILPSGGQRDLRHSHKIITEKYEKILTRYFFKKKTSHQSIIHELFTRQTHADDGKLHPVNTITRPLCTAERSFLTFLTSQKLHNPVNHLGVSGQVDMAVLIRRWQMIVIIKGCGKNIKGYTW